MFNRINQTDDLNSVKRDNKKRCCDASETRFIVTHGEIIDSEDFFELKEGYNVIFLAEYGECIWTNERKRETIKKLYKDGHSFFQNNDTNPYLTAEGYDTLYRLNLNIPKLFIGGVHTIFGVDTPIKVPNVQLKFGGTACDRGTTSLITSTTPVKIYPNCYLQCISKEDRCEKYYFSEEFDIYSDNPDEKDREQQLEFSKSAINTENQKGISLQTLLENEGPGNYIIMCCLQTENKDSKVLYDFMSKIQHIEHGPVSTRTRTKKNLFTKLKSLITKPKHGGKLKSKKAKNQKTKKQKSKKVKKAKKQKTKNKKAKNKNKKAKNKKPKSKKAKKQKSKKAKN